MCDYKFDSVFHDFKLKMTVNMSKYKSIGAFFLFICFFYFLVNL